MEAEVNAGRGGIAGRDVTLSNDGTRTDEADANDDALQDIRVTRRIGSKDGDRGLHEAAAGHRNQWECTETGAAFRAGAIPADRQGEDERHQQMHKMVEAVAPDAEHLGH